MPKLDQIKTRPSSGWNHIDALLDTGPGWNWLMPYRNVIYYSFSTTAGLDPLSAGITGAVSSFTTTQQNAVNQILAYVSQLTGIQFSQVSDGKQADVHFGNANISEASFAGLTQWNYNYWYDGAQNITEYKVQAYIYIDNAEGGTKYQNPQSGDYAYELLLHEIGHMLGLKHPFADGILLPAAERNTNYTLMAYDNVGTHSEYSPYDVAALAWLYGGDGLGGQYGVSGKGHYLIATTKDDQITGSIGSDVLDGLTGKDTVTYAGTRQQFQLKRSQNEISVSDAQSKDRLLQIEKIQFLDMSVNLEVQALAKMIPDATLRNIEELYVAFFNRIPDADGMAYWIKQAALGSSITQIAQSFYQAGLAYPQLTGYQAGMSHADFVNTVYRNVLGRKDGADAEGLAYWSAGLANGSQTHGSLVMNILYAAHGFKHDATWGWVANLLDNKITVAHLFAVNGGLNYNTQEESINMGMKIAEKVTPTSIDAAISLIGVSVEQLNALQFS